MNPSFNGSFTLGLVLGYILFPFNSLDKEPIDAREVAGLHAAMLLDNSGEVLSMLRYICGKFNFQINSLQSQGGRDQSIGKSIGYFVCS